MDQSAGSASFDAQTDIEGSLQHLKLQDCSYFLRTGNCAFGPKCRYNHPTAEKPRAVLPNNSIEDLPEHPGQMECQFFMKTGTCKFGSACWYHHPRQKSTTSDGGQVLLNFLGLPLRPGEKECAYYLQTGSCKYGNTCKFHHPQPTTSESVQPSTDSLMYSPIGFSTPSVAYQGQGTSWSMARAPFMPPPMGVLTPSNFMPLVTSSPQPTPDVGTIPFKKQGQALPMLSEAERGAQLLPRGVNYPHSQGQVTTETGLGKSTATIVHGQTIFPERPGQPDCHHYMKTGDCKFGMSCKYHHPKDRTVSLPAGLNPMGLPLRPGKQSCPYYVRHGICKFGPVCKFDHPVNVLPGSPPYSPSLSSLNEIPVVPLAPESSSMSPGSTLSERPHSSGKGEKLQESKTEEPVIQDIGESTGESISNA